MHFLLQIFFNRGIILHKLSKLEAFMSKNLLKAYSLNLGFHRGNKRIWFDSKRINETKLANDMSYSIQYDMDAKKVSLVKGNERSITSRKNGRSVIDINNATVSQIFDGFTQIVVKIQSDSIVIEPLREEIEQAKAHAKSTTKTPTFLEIFAGGGTLLSSLKNAGFKPLGAIELEDKYLENAEANNPHMFTYCGDLAKLDVSLLPIVDMVVGGIPCEGYSPSQLGKNKKEAHPTGSLGFYFLKIVEAIRPATVLIEEVPNFGNSAMAAMCRFVLKSLGYKVSEQLLSGSNFGSLTKRKRYVMVANIKEEFDFERLNSSTCNKTVADILEVSLKDRVWLNKDNSGSIAYSLKKEHEHIRKGEGFRLARTSIHDDCVATITKGYYQNRLTDPILVNPKNEEEFSWFTPRELARINGLPDSFILPETKGTAGEVIGQGVCYDVFFALGKELFKCFIEDDIAASNDTCYSPDELRAFSSGVLFA